MSSCSAAFTSWPRPPRSWLRPSECCCPICGLAAPGSDHHRRGRPALASQIPGYIAVGYVNTTAEVKAELDYCCTSGNVLDVIDAIPEDKGILFCPDFFLGAHVKRMRPNRRIEVWLGECHVHREINPQTLDRVRHEHPDAEVLVHPECGCAGQLIYAMGLGDIKSEGSMSPRPSAW